jgi:hypothetical protein
MRRLPLDLSKLQLNFHLRQNHQLILIFQNLLNSKDNGSIENFEC